eukprot:Nk52_evm1s164 gene=Nk52_evmTU1s164
MADQDNDDELALPKATVFKLLKEMCPDGLRLANDSRELLLDCCTEFIHLIASECNEAVAQTAKKTIGPEHVLMAIENLGFTDYVEEVKATLDEHKEQAKSHKQQQMHRINSGMSEAEMIKAQQELFAKARANYNPLTEDNTSES